MLFATPEPAEIEREVLEQIEELKLKLKLNLHEPPRWFGSLRRVQFARDVQGSNSIEGFSAELDDAAAIDLGEAPLDADEETRLAIKGYRDAMTFVLQLANDPSFVYSDQLLKSLQFMMTNYDLKNRPGQWRPGAIFVRNENSGDVVYEGADVDDVPKLMFELVDQLNDENESPPVVRAGMAHLNLVLVHPFRDGNGRMARCLQTLVLAREGILSPVFCSIEEYLGRNTHDYYDILADVGGGSWQPRRDARPWVRFILKAHLRQARTMVQRIKESERLWDEIEKEIRDSNLPTRVISALWDAAMGFRVRNSTYRAICEDEIAEQVAGRDLRLMADAGLLVPHGERRGRYYIASGHLRRIRQAIIDARDPRDDSDPFAKTTKRRSRGTRAP
jgi:Fic family protein